MINNVLIMACTSEQLCLTAWHTTALPAWSFQPFMAVSSSWHGSPVAHRSSRTTARPQANTRLNPGLPLHARKPCL